MIALISVLLGCTIFCGIYSAFYTYGANKDRINRRISCISGKSIEDYADEELKKPLTERLFKPLIKSINKIFGKYFYSSDDSKKSEQLRKMLRQAGLTILPSEYNAIRLIVMIGFAALFILMGYMAKLRVTLLIFAPLMGAYAAFALMRFSLFSNITKRRRKMESQLPDILDMISVNVEAGLGFEQAILHIINHFEGPLVDEFTITYREMTMGRSRRDALMLLGERTGIEDVKTFAGAVIQAGKMGISLKNVLQTQSQAIRESRRNKIEERAMKISVKMLLPMVIFIFPVIFIALMGPAVIRIIEELGGM